jgi:dihydropyrimidinase
MPEVLADYSQRAAEKAVIDYGFHLILANPDATTRSTDLPAGHPRRHHLAEGLHDLRPHEARRLPAARRAGAGRAEGALVMMHAENHDMIRWIAQRLLDRGHTAPKFHGVAHDATGRDRGGLPRHRAVAAGRRAGAAGARGRRRHSAR